MATFPYKILLKDTDNQQKIRWCTENFGDQYRTVNRDGVWAVLWAAKENRWRWHFAREEDMLWFKLRWE